MTHQSTQDYWQLSFPHQFAISLVGSPPVNNLLHLSHCLSHTLKNFIDCTYLIDMSIGPTKPPSVKPINNFFICQRVLKIMLVDYKKTIQLYLSVQSLDRTLTTT